MMKKTSIFILLIMLFGCSQKTVVIADFESNTFGNWIVEGDAFGNGPVAGAISGQQTVTGFKGKRLANSFHGGDDSRGMLISPEFIIERDFINFLMGGGKQNDTYIELLVNGESTLVARPVAEGEMLQLFTWDVKNYTGQKAIIRIVDNQRGNWGHILIDHIEMSNTAQSNIMPDYKLTFAIDRNYLLMPIEDKAPETYTQIFVDGKLVNYPLHIRLAQEKIDYWMPIQVAPFKDKELTMQFRYVKKTDIGFSQIKQSDTYEFNYNETYRPAFHFSPYYGWTNDPNGMVYHNGEYHLHYQHNPYGSMWGNMSWGHAVSKDLIHWEHLPVAITPDECGTIFSGSTVVDKDNTAGFGKDALVSIYTLNGERQSQSIAYSLDNGRTFTKYRHNPVLKNPGIADFRDPKVFWHDESKKWVMSLATSQSITFYGSTNLKEWEKLSAFGENTGAHGGVWECPDLFTLKTPGGTTKWVLLASVNPGGPNGGSATQYFIGNFDGKTFVADKLPYPLWIDYGRDNYAGVTWNNIPQTDGRRIFMGWMSNWDYANNVPTSNFRNAMTLPRELSLIHNGKHLILASNPVKETEKLRKEAIYYPTQRIDRHEMAIEELMENNDGTFELEMNIVPNGSSVFGFGFTNSKGDYITFTFDNETGKLLADRGEAGISSFSHNFTSITEAPLIKRNEYHIRLFIDKASVELFVNEGEIVMTNLFFPREAFNRMNFFSPKANWVVKDIKIYAINQENI